MPRIADRRRWNPGARGRVDWQNPLAVGLQGYGCGFDEWTSIPRRVAPVHPHANGEIVSGGSPWGPGLAVTNGGNQVTELVVQSTQSVRTSMMGWISVLDVTRGGSVIGVGDLSVSSFTLMLATTDYSDAGNTLIGEDFVVGRSTGTLVGSGPHSIACTFTQGGTVVYYIDGSYVASTSKTNVTANTPWYIEAGALRFDFYGEFEGIQGPWAVWNRLLTAGEIAKLHGDPLQMLRR